MENVVNSILFEIFICILSKYKQHFKNIYYWSHNVIKTNKKSHQRNWIDNKKLKMCINVFYTLTRSPLTRSNLLKDENSVSKNNLWKSKRTSNIKIKWEIGQVEGRFCYNYKYFSTESLDIKKSKCCFSEMMKVATTFNFWNYEKCYMM